MIKKIIALVLSATVVGSVQAAEVSVGGIVQMFVYLDQSNNEDNPEVENGEVALHLEASESVGFQTGYIRYQLDGGLKGDDLSTGEATAGIRGRWGELSIGTTTDLSDWGQYGNDIFGRSHGYDDDNDMFDPGHEFDKGSIGYVRDVGSIKFGLGYTPAQNAMNEAGSAVQLDSIIGIGLEFLAGEYKIGLNTQDAATTLGIKGMFGSVAYGVHYIDVDGSDDEVVGFMLGGKSGNLDMALSYSVKGDDDKTRFDLKYPVAGVLSGVARIQDDFTRVGLSMEF